MVLSLVLAESSIELVPEEIAGHPAILSSARRKGKDPRRIILDQSYHHAAIQRLGKAGQARGRPDIAHFSLLLALGAPLNLDGQLRCLVHTRDDKAIRVSPRTRLPRNTDRFVTLLEQLYQEKVVPQAGQPLLSIEAASLSKLVKDQNAGLVVALTTEGALKPMREVARRLSETKKAVLLVGGFPHGHFSKDTLQLANETYRIDKKRLEAWTVVARAIYDYEQVLAPRSADEKTILM